MKDKINSSIGLSITNLGIVLKTIEKKNKCQDFGLE